MPTYDFSCDQCGRVTEHFYLSMRKAPLELYGPCSCKKDQHILTVKKRIISPGAGFTFNQPRGTQTGARKEKEVRDAMSDFTSGKNKKESD